MGQPQSRTPVAGQLVDIGAAALGALGLVLFTTTRYGPGISPDSAAYLSIAEKRDDGHGFVIDARLLAVLFVPLPRR